jgi:hypothetical protein
MQQLLRLSALKRCLALIAVSAALAGVRRRRRCVVGAIGIAAEHVRREYF